MATAFRNSAEILQEKLQNTEANRPAVPYYYLISHSCELLLKSALLKRGTDKSELKNNINLRHNLFNLSKLLESKNVALSANTKSIIEILSLQHLKHDLRYTAFLDDGNTTYTPPADKISEMLDDLLLAAKLNK